MASASVQCRIEPWSHDGFAADLSYSYGFSGQASGGRGAEGAFWATLSGTLQVGTSSSFPQGASLQLTMQYAEEMTATGCWVEIRRGQTLLGRLDSAHDSATISVSAGEQLTVQSEASANFFYNYSESGSVGITFTPIPEPATLALLALGGLALARRPRGLAAPHSFGQSLRHQR